MLAGFAGHLISETFLEMQVAHPFAPDAAVDHRRRQLLAWAHRATPLGPSSSLRAMLQVGAAPLARALGFEPPEAVESHETMLTATVRGPSGHAALLVTAWGHRLDPMWRTAVNEAGRRAAIWRLLFNGTHVRIIDAGRPFARRHVEFNLDQALDDPRSCEAFWTVAHAGAPLQALISASDRHAAGVCRSLKDGVLTAAAGVLAALLGRVNESSSQGVADAFEQSLTIVYRIVFLLFAEARALVPVWHSVYRDSYSLTTLSASAEQPGGATGLWETLRAIAHLAHAGCRAGDLTVTPFNGRLFAPARTPLAERRDLDDEAARRVVLALSTRPAADRAGRERIAYRDLGVEQLGAVYETLLDYEPKVERGPMRRGRPRDMKVALASGSGVRKATGTFYTPQPIADYLVRRTLDPLVRGLTPERILSLRVVDPAMGSGAFLVAACRHLARSYESAMVEHGGCHPGDISDEDRSIFRRTIAERCLYGVDLNPMAVQLARLSLWLATLAADRPLSFLDHRLQVGDSLVGAWVTDLKRPPARISGAHQIGAPALPLFDSSGFEDVLRDALPVRFSLENVPNDTLDQVRAKERAFAAMQDRGTSLAAWKRVADLWCASWFSTPADAVPSRAFNALMDVVLGSGGTLPATAAQQYLAASERIASRRRFFHWELEFPEVFFAADGTRLAGAGFDAVIGNPPWDMIRADAGGAERRTLEREDARLVLRFTRDAGIYRAQSDGHANRYQLFLERATALTRTGGRMGLVLPWGLASDSGSAALRRLLFHRCDVDELAGFDNRRALFPIHRSVRFVLVTASVGGSTTRMTCRLGLEDPAALESTTGDASATSPLVHLTPDVLRRLSGDDLAVPYFRTAVDLAIAERAAALFPRLGADAGWRARFGREVNATDDHDSFRGADEGLPVVDGRQIGPFRVDLASARRSIRASDARRLLPDGRYTRARLAYRDVASATNRVTLIAALLPAACVSTHTVFCLRTPLGRRDQYFLCGLFNSVVVNFLVRLRVTTHVTTAIVEGLPMPTRAHAPGAAREIAAIARRLAQRDDADARARLHAAVARPYQLTPAEFAHVLSTFPLIPQSERDAAFNCLATQARRTQR